MKIYRLQLQKGSLIEVCKVLETHLEKTQQSQSSQVEFHFQFPSQQVFEHSWKDIKTKIQKRTNSRL